MSRKNMAASVRARLLKLAKETQQDFNLLVTRYCIERLMYRLSYELIHIILSLQKNLKL